MTPDQADDRKGALKRPFVVRLFSRASTALGPGIGGLAFAVVLQLLLPLLSFAPLALAIATGGVSAGHLRADAPSLLFGTLVLWMLISLWLQAGVMHVAVQRVRGGGGSLGEAAKGLLGAPTSGLLFGAIFVPALFGLGATLVSRLARVSSVLADLGGGVLAAVAVIWLLVVLFGGSFAIWLTTDRRYGFAHALRVAWERTAGRRFRALTVNVLTLLPWLTFSALIATRAPFAIGVALVLVVPVSVVSLVMAATGYVLLVAPKADDQPPTGRSFLPGVAWAAGAVFLHLLGGSGGVVVARVAADRQALAEFVGKGSGRFGITEVEVYNATKPEKPTEEPPKDPAKEPPPKPPEPKITPQELAKLEQLAKLVLPPPEKKPPPKPEAKPKPLPKPLIVKKPDEEKRVLPDLESDKRIAIKQHSEKNQAENPNAKFIAEQANRVKEETAARLTSHDRNDPKPTPGGQNTTNSPTPGDSHRTKIADSESHKGAKDLAPGEKGSQDEAREKTGPQPKDPVALNPSNAPSRAVTPSSGDPARPPTVGQGPVAGAPDRTQNGVPQVADGAPRTAQAVVTAPDSSFSWGTAEEVGVPKPKKPSIAKQPRVASQFGLGHGAGPQGGLNLNLTEEGVVRVKGADSAQSLRQASGERRRSEHRGSWNGSVFERMRTASENYVANVKPGNQTALNAASSAFATYLQTMHNRIHPIFADSFLESLSNRSREDLLNNPRLITTLEIVLRSDGSLAKMGVIKSSGEFQFDVGALDSVNRAQPFGKVPAAIMSPDGNTYLHWQFHRDEVYACSTMNARPYILRDAPKSTDPPYPPAGPKPPTKERFPSGNDTREGSLDFKGLPSPFMRMLAALN